MLRRFTNPARKLAVLVALVGLLSLAGCYHYGYPYAPHRHHYGYYGYGPYHGHGYFHFGHHFGHHFGRSHFGYGHGY